MWPAALTTAARPLECTTWRAAMAVITDRIIDDPAAVRRMGWGRFQAAVRREVPRWGGQRVTWRIARGLWDATWDTTGVAVHRHGALERIADAFVDWQQLRRHRDDVEARMVAILDDLDLTDLVTARAEVGSDSPSALVTSMRSVPTPSSIWVSTDATAG